MEILDFFKDKDPSIIFFFVAPGFISLKIWGILNSAPRFRLSESLLEAVVYSCFNLLVIISFFDKLKSVNTLLAYGVSFIICPILWPIVVNLITKIRAIKTRITPTAWDHYFSEGEDCFVLIHMKADGEMIGGLFNGKSFASSYPEKEDIYLEELWKIDEDGKFKEKVKSTNGLLVNFEEIKYIEFFKLGIPLENIPPVPVKRIKKTNRPRKG